MDTSAFDEPTGSANESSDGLRQRFPQSQNIPQAAPPPNDRQYRPRTCRICFDVVQPTTRMPPEHLPELFQSQPEVVYEDESGRLIRPCKCKGSSKYVHEDCLAQWRLRDVNSRRHFYECPTCKFQYRLSRLGWASLISSSATRIALTLAILFTAAFVFGFFAETIINLGLDPYAMISDQIFYEEGGRHFKPKATARPGSWFEHFTNGFVSLGIVGCLKVMLSNPLNWIHGFRGIAGGRPGRNARERMSSFTWVAVLIGIMTVLYGVWKLVQNWSARILRNVEQRVMDVHDGADEDDEDDAAQ